MIFVWDFHLLNLSKVLGELGQEIEMHLYLLAKFTKCFKQVQQVKVLNKGHEDLCWPLIDTYKLAVYRQYLYLVIYRSHRRKKLSHFLGVILHPGWNHQYMPMPSFQALCLTLRYIFRYFSNWIIFESNIFPLRLATNKIALWQLSLSNTFEPSIWVWVHQQV